MFPAIYARAEGSVDKITHPFPPVTADGIGLVVAASIMIVLTTLWTVMRCYARQIVGSSFQAEDYFYFAGQLFFYGVAICFILGITVGGGGHDVFVLDTFLHLAHFQKIFLAAQVLYAISLLSVKMSIILLLRRIFAVAIPWFRITSLVAIVTSVLWGIYTAILGFVICQPIQSAWDITVPPTRCGNFTYAFSAVAIFDILTDLIILMPALKIVRGLQMQRPHKIALMIVFGAGFVTMAFSGVRLYYTLVADFVNITRGFATASVSGAIQLGIAVIVASSPMLRPVFDKALVNWFNIKLLSSSNNNGKRGQDGSMTIGGISSRPSQPGSHMRSNGGFQHMSESEEHLAWEMQGLGKKSDRQTSTIHAGRSSEESGQTPREGDIVVTATITTSLGR